MDVVAFVDSIPPEVVGDSFDGRTVAAGFGTSSGVTASMRPRWGIDIGTAANFSVSSGTARIALTAAGSAAAHHTTLGVTAVEFDKTVRIRVPAVATGAPLRGSVFGRYTDADNHYRIDAIFETAGTITFRIARSVATAGTVLATIATGLAYTANSWWRTRFQLTAGGTWRAKIWADGGSEPGSWTVTATETPVLPPGRIGVGALRETSNSNGTVTFEFDDYGCTSAPTTRLDLNDGAVWGLNYEGTEFPPADLDLAAAASLLRDGAEYPASAYVDRRLRLRFDLHTSTPDGSATQLQLLAREVNRPKNVIKWQVEGMSKPVYLRTHRSPLGRVTEVPGGGNLRYVDVEVLAEPFGYRPKQILPPSTVVNDPAVANGQQFDIPAAQLLGDVDTPLILRLPGSVVAGTRSLVAVRSRDLSGLQYVLQAEAGTNGTDTTNQADAAFSGGSGKRCSFATSSSLVNRITWTQFPAAPALPKYRGKYRILLRHRQSASGDQMRLQLRWGGTLLSDSVAGDLITVTGSTSLRWTDLGQFQLPPSDDPVVDGFSDVPLPAAGVVLALQVERVSGGTGTFDMDCLVFVPCDETTTIVGWTSVLGAFPDLGVIDGPRQRAYGADFAGAGPNPGAVADHAGISVEGVWPSVNPGVDNRIYILPTVNAGPDALSTTFDVAPEYWPRVVYTAAP